MTDHRQTEDPGQQVIPIKSGADALAWGERSLTSWTVQNPKLPAGMTRAILVQAYQETMTCLEPATAKGFLVALDKVFEFAESFGLVIEDKQSERTTKYYRSALGDLPQEVLEQAINRAIRSHRYGNRLLLPGEIRDHADGLMGRLLGLKFTIEMALRFGREST